MLRKQTTHELQQSRVPAQTRQQAAKALQMLQVPIGSLLFCFVPTTPLASAQIWMQEVGVQAYSKEGKKIIGENEQSRCTV